MCDNVMQFIYVTFWQGGYNLPFAYLIAFFLWILLIIFAIAKRCEQMSLFSLFCCHFILILSA